MSSLILPTPAQVAWADCEVGVIIHLDVQVFEPSYEFRAQWGYTPSPQVFAPKSLDTDQWLEAAAKAGALYAVLVAKHCSGFSLWPTAAHDYSIASSPWKSGQGDLVADFFASCARYHIRPGLYYSASCNAYCDVDNPGLVRSGSPEAQAAYNAIVLQQITELWTQYGDVFEIWFDGGVLPPEQGGPDIAALLAKLQPNAVVFQGPPQTPSLLRWVGNESGDAPDPCWSTTDVLTAGDGTEERREVGAGDPAGRYWAPAECDMPIRSREDAFQGGWFWRKGEDHHLYSTEHLVSCYERTVGRNGNLLLGMVIDDQGLVPDADCQRMEAFGAAIRKREQRHVAQVSGRETQLDIRLLQPTWIDQVTLMEDLTEGERVRRYEVIGHGPAGRHRLAEGIHIGHKRIARFAPRRLHGLTLHILDAVAPPVIRQFAAFGEVIF